MIVLMEIRFGNRSSGPELDMRILRGGWLEEIWRVTTALIERSKALLQAFSFLWLFLDIFTLPEANSVPLIFIVLNRCWNIEASRSKTGWWLDAVLHKRLHAFICHHTAQWTEGHGTALSWISLFDWLFEHLFLFILCWAHLFRKYLL